MRTVMRLSGGFALVVSHDGLPKVKSDQQYDLASVGLAARMSGMTQAWAQDIEDWLRHPGHKPPEKPSEMEKQTWGAIRSALAELKLILLRDEMKDGAA